MVVIAALTYDKRRTGVSPARKPGGARAPKPINMPSESMNIRGTATWGNKLMPPAPNAWGPPSLMYPKNDDGSGAPSHIDDRPSSGGSSDSSSTVGSDFLDFLSSHSQTAKGSLQLSRLPSSFSDVLKAPLRTISKQAPTSHGNGFNLSMDDFPVLGSNDSKPKSQQVTGHSTKGRLTFDSGRVAAQDEQKKSLVTGVEAISSSSYEHENILRTDYIYKEVDPVPVAKLSMRAQQAQLHGPQAPNICTPPPCLDYWHPPPDQPPDRSGILQKGAVPYGPYKHADPLGSFAVESRALYDQFLLNQEAAARQGPGHGGCHRHNGDPYHPHMLADPRFITEPPHILGKVKDDQSNALERQPIIKKDVALLEKIKCLNNKFRNRCALNLSKQSSSNELEVKHPKNIGAESGHVTNDVPLSATTSKIVPAFDRLNSVSASSSFVPINPPNVSANGVMSVASSEGQVTEFSEAVKSGKSADYYAYGSSSTSRNRHDGSAKAASSSITGHGWEENSTVDSLRGVVMTDAQQNQPFPLNSSREVHMTSSDTVLNLLDYEVQHSRMKYLSAQAAKQLQDAEDWISQQNAKTNAKLEELTRRPSVQSQKSNDAPSEADNLYCRQKMGGVGTSEHGSLTADTCCIVSADALNAPRSANGVKNITVSIGSTLASNTAGVSKGPLIHNVMSSAKNTEVNMMEYIVHRSISQSDDSSAPKHWQMENGQRQFDSQERNIKDRSNFVKSAEHVKHIAKTPVDTQSGEPKHHEDLLSRNKKSRRDTAAVRPASPPVFVKNTAVVSTVHKTHVPCVVINSSTIRSQVTSVPGIAVGSIMLEEVLLASANQEWPAAGNEVSNTKNSSLRPQQTKKSGKNQQSVLPVENLLGNDSVMWTPIKQPSKKKHHEEGGVNSMPTKSTGIDRYKELHQQNLGQTLPAENHTLSYDNWEKSNLETKSHDKEALADLDATKAEVATELGNCLDRKTSWDHEGRPRASWKQKSTNGLASVVQNLAEPAGYFGVTDVVLESSNQCRQVKEQSETMAHDATEDHSNPSQTVPMPSSTWEPFSVNTWERCHASDSPRHYHVEGQRNVGSNYGYKERVGRRHFFHETPDPSRARWIPKYISHPQSNAPDNGVSEWLWDSHQPLSETDNSQGFHSKLSQIVDRDGEMDLIGGQVNVDIGFKDENTMIWNEKEWEYQQLNPAPHHHEQHEGHEDENTMIWNEKEWEYQQLNPAPHHHEQHEGHEDENAMIWNEKEWEYQQLNPAPHHHEQHEGRHHISHKDENTMICNEKEWEYQQLNPAPHHHEQREGRRYMGHGIYWGRDGDAGEPTYDTKEAKRKGGGRRSEYQPIGSSNVGNVVDESSNQWLQVEQFESKSHDATEDLSEPIRTILLPVNSGKRHRASDDPRRLHVEGQRKVGSTYGYKERVGTGCFFPEPPALSKAHSNPHNNAQDNGINKWLWDSQQGLSDMDNSQVFDSKQTQVVDRDFELDVQAPQVIAGMSSGDDNLIIWNEKEWEYQQLCPTPQDHGQDDGTHHRDSHGGYRGRGRGRYRGRGQGRYMGKGRGAGEPTYKANEDMQTGRFRHSEYQPELVGSCDAAPAIRWDQGADDHRSKGRLASSEQELTWSAGTTTEVAAG